MASASASAPGPTPTATTRSISWRRRTTPPNILDQLFPARLLRYSINRDSGGPGRFRGGCGVVREIEWLGNDAILSNRLDGSAAQPWGVSGGKSGRPGKVMLNPGRKGERLLPPLGDNTKLKKGDVIRMETTGGGGWGHPFDREPARVLADVLGDFISPASAAADYGVVLTADGRAVDETATAARRRDRHPSMMFHRVEYRERMD